MRAFHASIIITLAVLAVPSNALALDVQPYCAYQPNWPVFRAGAEVVQHSQSHSGANSPGSTDRYEILLPRVNGSVTSYETPGRRIALQKGDELKFEACGCVQTGGVGKTWKRYVNPTGSNSDRLYHGGVILENAAQLGLPTSATVPGLVRFQDLLAWQAAGKRVKVPRDAVLVLGYEDDNYKDNGYSSHDDGNDDQCKGIGSAAIQVVITH